MDAVQETTHDGRRRRVCTPHMFCLLSVYNVERHKAMASRARGGTSRWPLPARALFEAKYINTYLAHLAQHAKWVCERAPCVRKSVKIIYFDIGINQR